MTGSAALRLVDTAPVSAPTEPLVRPVASGYESWGRYPHARPAGAVALDWSCAPPDLEALDGPLLPYGLGRSYGDVCLNDGGIVLDTRRMSRILKFDRETGLLHCEAGASLSEILDLIVPHGWFPPVTPGTRHITIGGAIANDVHGKNHHVAGTFGRHVTRLELLRSDNRRLWCSPTENRELFAATVGGLGLTGLILSAEFRLRRIPGRSVAVERIRYGTLSEFFSICRESDASWEYTVAWVDSFATGRRLGRGVFMRGNHVDVRGREPRAQRRRPGIPFQAPSFMLATPVMRAANIAYYRNGLSRMRRSVEHYEPFFYPLDAVDRWNLLYGRRGFLQYQCVVPHADAEAAMRELLAQVAAARGASFLTVLKQFGAEPSPGLLSFPRPGVTLALDMPLRGDATLRLCERLDTIVALAGGAVYPCKDARMSPAHFRSFFPESAAFERHVDPRFSSGFWRRVSG